MTELISGFVIFVTDLDIAEVESLTLTVSEEIASSGEPSQSREKELDSEGDVEHSNTGKRKLPRLFSRYDSHTQKRKVGAEKIALTAKNRLVKYLEEVDGYDPTEGLCHVFHLWADNKKKFLHPSNLAMKALSIPASSAPVERVFSRGGLIMRSHRARLGAETLSKLIFLKCNETLLDNYCNFWVAF